MTNNVTGNEGDAGGLVGHVFVFNADPVLTQFTIENSFSSGNVTGDGDVGGIIGGTEGEGPGIDVYGAGSTGGLTLQNVYASGTINGNEGDDGAQNAGGLVGFLSCYSNNSENPYSCSVVSSYSTASVSGYQDVGGLIGLDEGDTSVADAYTHGNVSGNANAGGLIGSVMPDETNLSIDRTYASGTVSTIDDTPSAIGGLIGQNSSGTETLADSFSAVDLEDAGGTATELGWVVGDLGVTPANLWYAPRSELSADCIGQNQGSGDPSAFCTSEDSPSFFQTSTTNGPFGAWDFSTVWVDHDSDYPTLTGVPYTPPPQTEVPTLTSPASSTTYMDNVAFPITFVLPEDMESGTLQVTFTPTEGSPITLHLTDAESGGPNTKTITPSGGILENADVVSADPSVDSIPDGTYTVTISYKDSAGDTAGTASATNVVIAAPGAAPVLAVTNPIASQTTADNAIYTFSNTGTGGEYQVAEITQSVGGAVATYIDPVYHRVTFTGLQTGGTYSTSFSYKVGGQTSNTLNIGPFTVIGGSSGGGGGGAGAGHVYYAPSSVTSTAGANTSGVTTPVTTTTPGVSSGGAATLFLRNLKQNGKDSDVIRLQKFLNANGYVITKSGAGSPGHETNLFGSLTKKALQKFQKAHGLTPDGIFGPKTRAAINAILAKNK